MDNAANLPLDILENIFTRDTQMRKPRRMMRLGAVCRNWRHVAWSLPQFWTFIDIYGDTAEFVDLCFTNSKDQPVTVYLRPHFIKYPKIIDLIFSKHSHLVERLDITISTISSFTWYNMCQNPPLPILKHLGIDISHNIKTPPIRTLICSASPPFLPKPSNNMSMPFVWEGLTIIAVSAFPVDQCLQLLIQCPSLTEMHVISAGQPTNWTIPEIQDVIRQEGGMVVRENLQELNWDHTGAAWSEVLMANFKFPNLKEFACRNRPPREFPDFLRAAGKLEYLTCLYTCKPDLIQFLRKIPCNETLQSIAMDFLDNGDEFIQVLRLLGDNFPSLDTLDFRTIGMDICENPRIVEEAIALAKTRSLNQFNWQYDDYTGPVSDQEAEAAEQAGMEMEWMPINVFRS